MTAQRFAGTRALLDAWDAGHVQRREQWALTFLSAVDPGLGREALEALSIGERDAGLLAARGVLFGRALSVAQQCPACGEQLETTLDSADLVIATPSRDAALFTLTAGACTLRFRLPTSVDLMAAADCKSVHALPSGRAVDAAHAALLARCVIEAVDDGRPVAPADLPQDVLDALSERMAQLDPQADLRLNLRCEACRTETSVVFDIVPFVWAELNAWAERLLREVHLLASTLGWSEDAILSLSDSRRRRYVAMAGTA